MQPVLEIAHLTNYRGRRKGAEKENKAACRSGEVCFSAEQLGLFSLEMEVYVRLLHSEQCEECGEAIMFLENIRGQGCDFSILRPCP